MDDKPLPRFHRGDVLKAADLTAIRERLQRQRLLSGPEGGIVFEETPNGTLVRVPTPGGRFLAVANGAIPPRSGTTPGAGNVTLSYYDGSALQSTGVDYDVLNASSSTMTSGHGIDSGMYCWIEQDPDGYWWVTPLECS